MKKNCIILAILAIFSLAFFSTSCSNKSSEQSQENAVNAYDKEIDDLEVLVNEIIKLMYQHLETGDDAVAVRGEVLCNQLNKVSYRFERYYEEGKLTLEQMNRINSILEKLPQ